MISLSLTCGCNDAAVTAEDDPGAALADEFEAIRQEFARPGLVVAFRQKQHPTRYYIGGVGRIGAVEPLRLDDPMHIASVSISFSATAIGTLVGCKLISRVSLSFWLYISIR